MSTFAVRVLKSISHFFRQQCIFALPKFFLLLSDDNNKDAKETSNNSLLPGEVTEFEHASDGLSTPQKEIKSKAAHQLVTAHKSLAWCE